MMQKGILKPEWLPQIPKGINRHFFYENHPDEAFRELQREQQAFCDVIGGCIRIAIDLGFSTNHYPDFLVELIKKTAESSPKSWQKRAAALPIELRTGNSTNVRDAVDDFIKTVFLPYSIQSDLEAFQPGSAQKLLDQMRLHTITAFLKGVSLQAICELSSHWHELGRAAQLNKAKTFSGNAQENSWEPLFSPSVQIGAVTAVPLTTSEELKKEGEALSHCIGGYTHRSLQLHSHIVSLRDENGTPLSTLELELCSGQGRERDPRIINIKGNSEYYLQLKQHYGKKNQPPPPQCKAIEAELLDAMRKGKITVDLSELEIKRNERLLQLKAKTDIILIGYDPTKKENCLNAIDIYRRHGIGNIACENTLRANFDLLTVSPGLKRMT